MVRCNKSVVKTSKSQPKDDEKRAQDDAKKQMLAQILESDARERLGRVSLTKPENAKLVEDYILQMARSGTFIHFIY